MQENTLANRVFGRLRVLDQPIQSTSNRNQKVKCKCECGNTVSVFSSNLIAGRTLSCGCFGQVQRGRHYQDFTGQVFGRITVIRKTDKKRHKRIVWLCRCSCGKEVELTSDCLQRGTIRSCGCLRKENPQLQKDLRQKEFGFLTVLELSGSRLHGSVLWKCRCRCGNIVQHNTRRLMEGSATTCGAYLCKKQYKEEKNNAE